MELLAHIKRGKAHLNIVVANTFSSFRARPLALEDLMNTLLLSAIS